MVSVLQKLPCTKYKTKQKTKGGCMVKKVMIVLVAVCCLIGYTNYARAGNCDSHAWTGGENCQGDTILLKGVTFDSGRSTLKPESYGVLDSYLEKVQRGAKRYIIEVQGFTDNRGDPRKNMKLSQDRADTVRNYYIQKGIKSKRIRAVGFGEDNPIASNASESGRAMNRRIEIKFVFDHNIIDR